jgi:hypothetical protein
MTVYLPIGIALFVGMAFAAAFAIFICAIS